MPRLRVHAAEFAGFDQRRDARPVFSIAVAACEECVLAIERYGPDGPLDGVAVDLDAAIV